MSEANGGRGPRVVVVNRRQSRKTSPPAVPVEAAAATEHAQAEPQGASYATVDDFVAAKRRNEPLTGHGQTEASITATAYRLRRLEKLLGKPVALATLPEVQFLYDTLLAEDKRSGTIRNLFSTGGQLLDWAAVRGMHKGDNPYRLVTRKTPIERTDIEQVTFTDRQIKQLFEKLAERGPRYNIFFRVMYYSGLQYADLFDLRWDQISARGLWVLDDEGNRDRQIPLPKRLLDDIAAYRREQGGETTYLFEGPLGKPVARNQPYTAFRNAIEALGWNRAIKPSTLRTTAAQRVQDRLGDIAMTQAFLGHTSTSSTAKRVRTTTPPPQNLYKEVFGDEG